MGNVGIGTTDPRYRLHVVEFLPDVERTAAILGEHLAPGGSPKYGVVGKSLSPEGAGVRGEGVLHGVFGMSLSSTGIGVVGMGQTFGVYGRSVGGDGTAVGGDVIGSGHAILGRSVNPDGPSISILGEATGAYGSTGVRGRPDVPSGRGVVGIAPYEGGIGVYGVAGVSGNGVVGDATGPESTGVLGVTGAPLARGVAGIALGPDSQGVVGIANSGQGVAGFGSGNAVGVLGNAPAPSDAVYANGNFTATGLKAFQIDHPLSPETHYLNHFCAEGPEPYNIYRGTVVLDKMGEAWVQLPDYFSEINRDPSYHLTAFGAPMPNLHIAQKIQNNRFKIAGGVPGAKVSWEVKAVRNDRWVQQHGFQTVQEKPNRYKGRYLHPDLYGQPKEKGIYYIPETLLVKPNLHIPETLLVKPTPPSKVS